MANSFRDAFSLAVEARVTSEARCDTKLTCPSKPKRLKKWAGLDARPSNFYKDLYGFHHATARRVDGVVSVLPDGRYPSNGSQTGPTNKAEACDLTTLTARSSLLGFRCPASCITKVVSIIHSVVIKVQLAELVRNGTEPSRHPHQ